MAQVCANCAKSRQYGHSVSHSKRRTNTTFKVNLHARRVIQNGEGMTVKLCTKCIKLLKKREDAGQAVPFHLQYHKAVRES